VERESVWFKLQRTFRSVTCIWPAIRSRSPDHQVTHYLTANITAQAWHVVLGRWPWDSLCVNKW